jgi:hypothetical protein
MLRQIPNEKRRCEVVHKLWWIKTRWRGQLSRAWIFTEIAFATRQTGALRNSFECPVSLVILHAYTTHPPMRWRYFEPLQIKTHRNNFYDAHCFSLKALTTSKSPFPSLSKYLVPLLIPHLHQRRVVGPRVGTCIGRETTAAGTRHRPAAASPPARRQPRGERHDLTLVTRATSHLPGLGG